MPFYCNIFSCKNFAGLPKGTDEKCKFFLTPTDIEQRDKWIKEIQKYQKIDQRLVICQLHFEPKYLKIYKTGIKLTKDAVPTIFDAKPLASPTVIQPILKEIASSSNEQVINPEKSVNCEQNVVLDSPTQQLITCNRCIQKDVTIKELKVKITQLQATCSERLCIIQGLRKEIQTFKNPSPIERKSSQSQSAICKETEDIMSPLTEQQSEDIFRDALQVQREGKSDFECFICKMKFKSRKATRHHLTENHGRNVKCFVCNQWFTSLEIEMHICSGLNSLNCSYCQQECTSTKSLLQHLNDCNKSEKLTYKCDCCRDYFSMESLLSVHMENHEHNKNEFVCNICTKNFATKYLLSVHKKRHNAIDFLCDECGKAFRNQCGLKLHKDKHKGKTFKCEKCGKDFTTKLGLQRHVKDVHQDLKLVCNICGAKMVSVMKLWKHKKNHARTDADRKHACNLCSLKFFAFSRLQRHLRNTHFANERYDCEFCKNSYKYKGDLNRHLRQHLGDDMYACSTCPKRFRYIYDLERHASEHYVAANNDNDRMETT